MILDSSYRMTRADYPTKRMAKSLGMTQPLLILNLLMELRSTWSLITSRKLLRQLEVKSLFFVRSRLKTRLSSWFLNAELKRHLKLSSSESLKGLIIRRRNWGFTWTLDGSTSLILLSTLRPWRSLNSASWVLLALITHPPSSLTLVRLYSCSKTYMKALSLWQLTLNTLQVKLSSR